MDWERDSCPKGLLQRVVTDIGNHIGKFVESDVNNFVGVWRDHFRVRVSIPLTVPLKRRMKLRKNATKWCWVNFKYKAVPTFCFICGLIEHNERFCDKLFEMKEDNIEKPYGAWMRADPKRRTYTMGNKWLRQGGATPANSSENKESDKSGTENIADEISDTVKSGIDTHIRSQGILPTRNEFQGEIEGVQDQSSKQLAIYAESNVIDGNKKDNNEIIFTDPKRRRLAHENTSPNGDKAAVTREEDMVDEVQEEQTNQKNLLLAGTASQSRHSS